MKLMALLHGAFWFFISGNLLAEAHTVSVIYPDVKPPYSKVFEDITAGIEKAFQGRVKRVVVGKKDGSDEIKKKLTKSSSDAVISLGSSNLRMVKSLDLSIPIIAGAIVKNGGIISGISMIPDGALVADILLDISPDLGQVHTLVSSPVSEELVDDTRKRLRSKGKDLLAEPVASYKEAAVAYKNLLSRATKGDAIWLLPGSKYLDNTLLSLILEVAWKKDLVVFSSNPSHVRRGALFAVYPDNQKMGEALGELADSVTYKSGKLNGLQPLKSVFVGVNQRTAKHLDIDLAEQVTGKAEVIVFAQ